MDSGWCSSLFSLNGKAARIAGASAGRGRWNADGSLGAALAIASVASRTGPRAGRVARNGGRAGYVGGELSDRKQLSGMSDAVMGAIGMSDILINATGTNARDAVGEVTPKGRNPTLSLKLLIARFPMQPLTSVIKDKGFDHSAIFVSLQSYRVFQDGVAHGTWMGSSATSSRSQAQASSEGGITLNILAPGSFRTGSAATILDDSQGVAGNSAQNSLKQGGELSDIVGRTLFNCSKALACITGPVLAAQRGITAK